MVTLNIRNCFLNTHAISIVSRFIPTIQQLGVLIKNYKQKCEHFIFSHALLNLQWDDQ